MSDVAQYFLRGLFIALLVLCPALILPDISQDVALGLTLLSLLAAVVVITEYSAAYPGLVEFRDAKPYNRSRFILISAIVLTTTLVQRDVLFGSDPHGVLAVVALKFGQIMDFPISPVRLLVMSLPVGLPAEHLVNVQATAALAYIIALTGAAVFFAIMTLGHWPRGNSAFNVWVNLPNFDPTQGVDVVRRLERDAQVNILLGIILPFSLPVLLHISTLLVQPMTLETPLALVWGVTLWAFVPVNLIMRGLAMYRIAQLVRAQRRRIAASEDSVPLPARSAYS
ncbi:MAG: hypothetical protein ACK4NW_00445 [Roseinatronobacter sp.]